MRVELLIKPCRSTLLSSDTQEIGAGIAPSKPTLLFVAVVGDANFEWPNPTHFCIIFFAGFKKQGRRNTLIRKGSRDPITPKEEIKIVGQHGQKREKRKAI